MTGTTSNSTSSTFWIPGQQGTVTQVELVERGTGGQDLTFVPPDPVVVRSVTDYFEFVASEGALIADKGVALEEARRLREEELGRIKRRLDELERQEVLQTVASSRTGGRKSTPVIEDSNKNPPEDGSTPKELVLGSEVSSVGTEIPAEVVPVKNSSETKPSKDPKTLLQRVTFLIGSDSLSFDELCTQLQDRHWMPKLRSSVSNVLSAHRNLFDRTEDKKYSLRIKNKSQKQPKAAAAAPPVEQPEDTEVEEQLDEAVEPIVVEQVAVEESVFDTWLGKPMANSSPNRYHYHDEMLSLCEQSSDDGSWLAEIIIDGLSPWFTGKSESRGSARELAMQRMVESVNKLNSAIDGLIVPS